MRHFAKVAANILMVPFALIFFVLAMFLSLLCFAIWDGMEGHVWNPMDVIFDAAGVVNDKEKDQ